MINLNWIERVNINIKTFQLEDEPEIIYVIKTGLVYEKQFIVVHEDGYDSNTGESEILNEKELYNKYKIKWT